MTARQDIGDALKRAYNLGQTYWQQADSDYTSDHKKSDVTAATFKQLVADTETAMRDHDSELAAEREKVRVLREALTLVIKRFGPCQENYVFSKRIALDQARAALTKTGTEK